MQATDNSLILIIGLLNIPNHPVLVLAAADHVPASPVEIDL